jgi:methylglutaconyl-CoA hydratase
MIKLDINNQVASVTLNRPEVHNALSPEMIAELTKIFLDLDKDKNVRVVVLAAEGKSFCAGADLNYMKSMVNASYEENLKDAEVLGQMFKTIYDCSKPIIAKVQGSAFGGGVGLISVCDIAISKDEALFALSEVRIGLVPGVISPFVVKKVGFSNSSRYFLTSERFDSNKAKEIGLVNEVVKDLDMKVNELVSTILENGPEAVSACKKLVRDVVDREINDALDVSKEYISKCRISKEGQEGMKAFLEKRKPKWTL